MTEILGLEAQLNGYILHRIVLPLGPLARYYMRPLSIEVNNKELPGKKIMNSKNDKDSRATNEITPSSTSTQPQKHFRPSIDEEAIPWAEIIFEEAPYSGSAQHSMAREPRPAENTHDASFSSRVLGTQAESFLDYQIVGPPLAVLAVVLLVFLLLLAAT